MTPEDYNIDKERTRYWNDAVDYSILGGIETLIVTVNGAVNNEAIWNYLTDFNQDVSGFEATTVGLVAVLSLGLLGKANRKLSKYRELR